MVLVNSMFFKKEIKCKYDMLIVGLGNPGVEYALTRHNIGFMVADRLREKLSATPERLKNKALLSEGSFAGKRVLIAKPQTFMNLSGQAVAEIVRFYKIPMDRVIIIFDDISLDVGLLRFRRNGSHGGHNGMKNISEQLSTNDIMRLKVGVGHKPHPDYDLKDWVLSRFSAAEQSALEQGVENGASAIEELLKNGIDRAMNKFNS